MTPAQEQALLARVAELERRTPRGVMVSQQAGGSVTRPYQVGMPVELTGPFDASTGYPWKALVLDPSLATGNVKADAALPTGDYAYTIDGNEGLLAGERGWLEVDPQSRGYLFLPLEGGGGVPAGCDGTGWGWVAGLLQSECLRFTVTHAAGFCAGIDDTQTGFLRWDGTAEKWVFKSWDGDSWEDDTFAHDNGTGTLSFWLDEGRPRLRIGTVTYDLVLVCGGDGTLVFAGGSEEVCDGTPPTLPGGACADNVFRITLECSCCPIDGWDGEGWYCVDSGDGCPGGAVELLDEDRCDDTVTICSGPYATQEDAEAVCAGPVDVACCDTDVPATLYAHFGGVLGGLLGTVTLTYDPDVSAWRYVVDPGVCDDDYLDIRFACSSGTDPGTWELSIVDCPSPVADVNPGCTPLTGATAAATDCSPMDWSSGNMTNLIGTCVGVSTCTVNETP